MKTTRKDPDVQPPPIVEYPRLMQYKNTEDPYKTFIVYFREPESGWVVQRDEGYIAWEEGYYTDTWVMDTFTDYKGTVTLSND